jgi:cell division septal protein FtsQ
VKRPEGFDEGPAQPAAPVDAAERAASQPPRRSIADRLRRGVAQEPTRPDDGLEARPASAPVPPDPGTARSARDLPELPDVDETATGTQRTSSISDAAGTAGRQIGRGFTAVASRLRELSPDEDFVDPHAPARPVRSSTPDASVRATETAHDARIAKRRRRLLERAEIRRFTRRARHRRAAWITAGSVVLVLVLSVVVAVYSPLMALTTIKVEGTSRVDKAQVQDALDAQLGTPLARVDFGEIKHELAGFPLIASYVTEEQPPHTLVVTITERQSIVAVKTSSGYELVDPAGIVVEAAKTKPAGMPEADIDPSALGGSVFRTMTDVVLSLPTSLRSTVGSVTASTADDVTLTLTSGSKVVWGNASDSDAKAALLAALVKDHDKRDPTTKVEYDVSAPDNGIIRSQS